MASRSEEILLASYLRDKRFSLQLVNRRVEVIELGDWEERTPRTQNSEFSEPGSIDADELTSHFAQSVVEMEITILSVASTANAVQGKDHCWLLLAPHGNAFAGFHIRQTRLKLGLGFLAKQHRFSPLLGE